MQHSHVSPGNIREALLDILLKQFGRKRFIVNSGVCLQQPFTFIRNLRINERRTIITLLRVGEMHEKLTFDVIPSTKCVNTSPPLSQDKTIVVEFRKSHFLGSMRLASLEYRYRRLRCRVWHKQVNRHVDNAFQRMPLKNMPPDGIILQIHRQRGDDNSVTGYRVEHLN